MKTKVKPFKKFAPQLKIADMISLGGAGMTGLGIGASLSAQLAGALPILMILGLLFMGLGMYGKFQIEREHVDPPVWVFFIFGACWIGLMFAALYLVIARFAVVV
jgi:hypothetical protein